jgi:integrase
MQKLSKPYPQFPLSVHPKGYWVKVIHGKQHRFGPRWCTPDEALDEYHRTKSDLEAGRSPEIVPEGLTLREGLVLFLQSRKKRLEDGAIVQRSYDDYNRECKLVRDAMGSTFPLAAIGPAQFSHLRTTMTGSPHVVGNRIGRVRVLFKYLFECGAIPTPVRYGPDFSKPSAKTLRLHRTKKPKKLYTPAQVWALINNAPPQLKAMIWLGLFCGFGNADCGHVEVQHLDLENGWVTFHRPKTGITRRAWIPPKAVEAIRAICPDSGPVFITRRGNTWSNGKKKNPIAVEFRKLAMPLGCNLGFYALRHTTETIGGRAKDQVALDFIMGHVTGGMSSVYREEVDDDRLLAVGQVIHKWLDVNPTV